MDYHELQDILSMDIELLKELRGRLTDDSNPLSSTDKQILRNQLSGNWLMRMHDEQRYFFVQGNTQNATKGFAEILDAINQLK
jgi:hypothetical protein